MIVVALALVPTTARAVEVRQPESQFQVDDKVVSYSAFLVRAYAPCTAPNDVSSRGFPACAPAITSACDLRFGGELAITKEAESHRIGATVVVRPGGAPECVTGPYRLDLAIRTTADSAAACPSGRCTFVDTVLHLPMDQTVHPHDVTSRISDQNLEVLLPFETTEQDVEILGFTIVGPDGLPLATAASFNGTRVLAGNQTVPHPPCTSPGPDGACDAAPWDSVCDFEVGDVAWSSASGANGTSVHAILRDLAGTSPLCTTGTFQVDATYRVTADECTNGARCTSTDQHVKLRIAANGRDLDGNSVLAFPGLPLESAAVEIVSTRVLDPLGAAIAVSGASEVRSLLRPKVAIAPDRLQLQATFPLPFLATALDPTEGDGLRVELSDRNGTFFDVTIPPERWQLQPPIGNRWDYKDPGGVLNGVRKARIKRVLRQRRLLGYALKLEVRDVDLAAADFPGVTVNVTLPGLPSGTFQAQQHRTCRAKTSKLDCR